MISLPALAGFASTVIFVASTLPMLVKARRSRNLTSYSLGNIALANLGNAVNSVYVYSLPPGPIWLLHTFYLVTSALMLGWYLRYGTRKPAGSSAARTGESPNAERARADHVKAGDEVFGHVCSRPRPGRRQSRARCVRPASRIARRAAVDGHRHCGPSRSSGRPGSGTPCSATPTFRRSLGSTSRPGCVRTPPHARWPAAGTRAWRVAASRPWQ